MSCSLAGFDLRDFNLFHGADYVQCVPPAHPICNALSSKPRPCWHRHLGQEPQDPASLLLARFLGYRSPCLASPEAQSVLACPVS